MSPDRPSSTALLVTALRALASTEPEPLIVDAHAGRFLPRSWARAIAFAHARPLAGGLIRRLPDAISLGRLQHIALRTRVIDDALTREMQRGTRQVVLLGAGFDTRAYRLLALAPAQVLEIDHPATQRRKRARAAGLVPCAREHRFVAVDLERDDLASSLKHALFDARAASVFVWEGVLMYLSERAIQTTLRALASSMAEGSLLIASYYDPSGASGPPSRTTTGLASLLGERFRTRLSPTEAARLVTEHGFFAEADTGRNDWAREHGVSARGRAEERLVFARRA